MRFSLWRKKDSHCIILLFYLILFDRTFIIYSNKTELKKVLYVPFWRFLYRPCCMLAFPLNLDRRKLEKCKCNVRRKEDSWGHFKNMIGFIYIFWTDWGGEISWFAPKKIVKFIQKCKEKMFSILVVRSDCHDGSVWKIGWMGRLCDNDNQWLNLYFAQDIVIYLLAPPLALYCSRQYSVTTEIQPVVDKQFII